MRCDEGEVKQARFSEVQHYHLFSLTAVECTFANYPGLVLAMGIHGAIYASWFGCHDTDGSCEWRCCKVYHPSYHSSISLATPASHPRSVVVFTLASYCCFTNLCTGKWEHTRKC